MLVNKVFMHLMIQSVTDSLVTLRQCQYPILNVSPSLTPRPWCYQEGWIQMSISGGTPKIGHWKVTCTLDLALEIADGHGIQTDIYNKGSMVAHIWAVFHFGGLVPKEAGIVSVIFSWHQGLATKGNIRRCKCGKVNLSVTCRSRHGSFSLQSHTSESQLIVYVWLCLNSSFEICGCHAMMSHVMCSRHIIQ